MKQKPTLDYLIMKFQHEIEEHYGVKDALTRIDLNHEAFNRMIIANMELTSNYRFRPSNISDLTCYGVRVNARERIKE